MLENALQRGVSLLDNLCCTLLVVLSRDNISANI
jgi:hypothetical protein